MDVNNSTIVTFGISLDPRKLRQKRQIYPLGKGENNVIYEPTDPTVGTMLLLRMLHPRKVCGTATDSLRMEWQRR